MQQRTTKREQMHSGMDTLMTSGFQVFDLATKLQAESLRFMSKRMEDLVRTSDELRQCKNPADFLNVQTNFFFQAFSEYQAEANRMIRGFLEIQRPVKQAITALEAPILEQDEENQKGSDRHQKKT
jgi:Phasin protein